MKALLRYRTAIGSRTIIAELGDADTARAIVNAHLALGEYGELVEEMPRLSLKQHMAYQKRKRAKLKLVSALADNVTPLRKARK